MGDPEGEGASIRPKGDRLYRRDALVGLGWGDGEGRQPRPYPSTLPEGIFRCRRECK